MLDALDAAGFAGGDHWVWSFHNYNESENGGNRSTRMRERIAGRWPGRLAPDGGPLMYATEGGVRLSFIARQRGAGADLRAGQAEVLARALARAEATPGLGLYTQYTVNADPELRLRAAGDGRAAAAVVRRLRGIALTRMLLLHGGTIRTMDPARPAAAALLSTATGSPPCSTTPPTRRAASSASTSRAAARCPGFTDAHVHFPSWALSRRELALLDAGSLGEAVALVAAAAPSPGGWIRGRGWRDELWPDGERPDRARARCGRAATGRSPCARTTATPCGSTPPRSRSPAATWRRRAAWSSATRAASRPGSCARRRPGATRRGSRPSPRRRSTRCARRCRRSPRRASSPSTTRTAGRARPRCSPRPRLPLRVWQSVPADAGVARGRGLRQGVHGRDARLAHRAAARRHGRGDHVRRRRSRA